MHVGLQDVEVVLTFKGHAVAQDLLESKYTKHEVLNALNDLPVEIEQITPDAEVVPETQAKEGQSDEGIEEAQQEEGNEEGQADEGIEETQEEEEGIDETQPLPQPWMPLPQPKLRKKSERIAKKPRKTYSESGKKKGTVGSSTGDPIVFE